MNTAGALIEELTEQLNYVLTTKESAIQQTLTLTENALSTLDNLKVVLQIKSRAVDYTKAAEHQSDDVLMQVAQTIDDVQQQLTELLMTQSFQDLTGQVLQKVMQELQRIDPNSALCDVFCEQPETAGFGPAATQKEKAGRVQDQSDVDDLLASMGL